MFDPQFDDKIRRWHSTCDQRISSSITTPKVSTITTTYDFGACGRLQKAESAGIIRRTVLRQVHAHVKFIVRIMRMPAADIFALLRVPVQRKYIVQADDCC